MSGPISMALGRHLFRAHGFSYTGISQKLETPWAQTETVGSLHTLQWVGPTSDEITINGVLFPVEFGGLITLESIKTAAKSGIPLPLVSIGGLVFGKFAIQGVEEDRSYINRWGTPRRDAYSIMLIRMNEGFSLKSLMGSIL